MRQVETLKGCSSEGNQVDPCLWIKNSSSGVFLMATYVDDCLTIEIEKAIDEVIESLKAYGFGLKVAQLWLHTRKG